MAFKEFEAGGSALPISLNLVPGVAINESAKTASRAVSARS